MMNKTLQRTTVNGGKMTVEVAHRIFSIKYGSIWVRNFKRTMVDQERCLPSGHTKHGGKGPDPDRRWRDELHLSASGWFSADPRFHDHLVSVGNGGDFR